MVKASKSSLGKSTVSGKTSLLGKKKREDRHAVSKSSYDPINIDVKLPKTAVILLGSEEEPVLLKALSSLDKYAAKSQQNVELLYKVDILDMLIPLLKHPQLYVRRFTIKLFSEMCFHPEVRDMLLKEQCYVKDFLEYLKANEDIVLKEFSSSIVAELTKLPEGYVQIIDSGRIDVLLPNLLCTDPDVQNNCLQIIKNLLLRDPYAKDLLIQSQGFQFSPMLDLLVSQYPAIQNLTLDILTLFTEWRTDNFLQEQFLNNGGVEKIIDIIQDFELKDIHSKCLNILANVFDNPIVLKFLQSNGANKLLRYIDNIHDSELRLKGLRVIVKLAATSMGRKMLLETEILEQIVPIILEESIGLTSSVCLGLVQLIKEPLALHEVVENGIIDLLLSVIKLESRGWDARGDAILLLYEILKRNFDSSFQLVENQKQKILINILMDSNKELPVNIATTIANLLAYLSGLDKIRDNITEPELVRALLSCFKERPEDTIPLRIAACEAFNSLICKAVIREWLHMERGIETIWNSLTQPSTTLPLLQVAANFIHFAILGDKTLASDLYRLGAFSWLLDNKALRNECPAWELALESLFNNFLPLKFAYTGRLDLTDIIDSTFYITRVPINPDKVLKGKFPNLKDLLDCGASPSMIVYVVNFEISKLPSSSSLGSYSLKGRKEKRSSINSVKRKSGKGSLLGLENTRSILTSSITTTRGSVEPCLAKLKQDAYLCRYLERVKEEINQLNFDKDLLNKGDVSKEPSVVDGNVVKAICRVVARFVSNQLCGPDITEPCTGHTLELHLTELKLELETCIIPIGFLRVGRYLERALLFKALADKVGLPSCLVRGQYGRAWVEVALPNIPTPPRPLYPSKLLRPNFIVDLMEEPGRLIRLNTEEAYEYCKS